MPLSNCTFGVEIEMEGFNRTQIAQTITNAGFQCREEAGGYSTWVVKSDGSLSNGFEVTTPILHGDAGIQEMTTVLNALQDAGGTADKQCGLHVHVGMDNYNGSHVRNLIRRYSEFETTIDSFMPVSRRGNRNQYCHSAREAWDTIRNSTSNRLDTVVEMIHERYIKVNLTAYHRCRTVEFRHHSGTCSPTKVKNWVLFCVTLLIKVCLQPLKMMVLSMA